MARRIAREDRATLIESMDSPGQRSTWRVVVTLAAFAAVFTVLEIGAYTQKSATMDEPIHLVAGYVALVDRDFRVDVTHPPFLRMWAALPLVTMVDVEHSTATIDRYPILDWLAQAYVFARDRLYSQDADRLLYAARFMTVLLGVLLGALLFAWTHEWLGFVPAVFVLAMYTIEPNLAAHATLVTTDLGTACFVFGTVYFLWRTCTNYTWRNIAGLAVFFSLAIVAKFSSVLLAPIIIVLLVETVGQRTSVVTFRRACALMGILAATSIAAVWLIYDFRYMPSNSPQWTLRLQDMPLVQERVPVFAWLVGWIDTHRLLPNAFTQGFLFSIASAQALPSYLLGNISTSGWWYYFPVAFLVKTPDALIALTVIGLVACWRRRSRGGISNELFVCVPIAAFMGFAMTSGIDIGIRHILPIYPFVLMIAGAGVSTLIGRRTATARAALVGLSIFWIVAFFRVYPNTLAFFNQLAGGPASGLKYLADSNLDWGQDLKGLKGWLDEHQVEHFGLAYFGVADPAYYRISCPDAPRSSSFGLDRVPLRSSSFGRDRAAQFELPGYVAISATTLSGVYLTPPWRDFYRSFLREKPVAEIGNSIFVYRVAQWPHVSFDALDPSFPSYCLNLPAP
jgi:Dolichyl-phosphate-mannose-protein mannosyltransferase